MNVVGEKKGETRRQMRNDGNARRVCCLKEMPQSRNEGEYDVECSRKGRMREEASGQELKIKEVDTRIEQEIANLRTNIQSSKATTLQYLVGFGEWDLPVSFVSYFYYYGSNAEDMIY